MNQTTIDAVIKSVSRAVGGQVKAIDQPRLEGITFQCGSVGYTLDYGALTDMMPSQLRATLVKAFGGKEEFTTKHPSAKAHPTDSWVEEYKRKANL